MTSEPLHEALNNWIPSANSSLASMVAEAMLIVDIANTIVFASERLTALIGSTKAALVGKHLFELVIATDGQLPDPGMNAPEWSYYGAMLATAQEPLWVQVASRTLHDINRSIVGSFLIIVEQSATPNNPQVDNWIAMPEPVAIATARTSDEQLQSLIASLEDLIFAVNLHGHILFYHQSAKSALRSTPLTPADAIIGKRFQDVLPEILSTHLTQAINTVISTLQIQQVEYSAIEKDQETYYAASVSPFFDTTISKLLGVTVVVRDVTDAVQYRMRQQHLFEFEQIQSAIAAKFFKTDDASTAINDLLPLLGAFLVVTRIYLYKIRDDEQLMDNIYEWCSVGTPSQKIQSQGLAIDGTMRTIMSLLTNDRLIAAPQIDTLPDDVREGLRERQIHAIMILPFYIDGRLRGFLGVSDSRHPRQWLPEEITIVRSVADSYGRAVERQQAQAALIQARDEALRSVRLKSEFMSNMSHEVRTPMTGMLGMLELLLETQLNTDQREFANTALSSARHLLRILDDILDFSKSESGKLVFEHKSVSITELVNEVIAIGQSHAGNKPVRLFSAFDATLPRRIETDPTRLRQVLMNLVNNAVKFTATGEIEVRVTAVSESKERVRIQFAVRDTGIGIPENQLANIFEPFVQADGSITRKYGGSGLGLAISKQIINLMGGELTVNSTVGEGSTFAFTLAYAITPDPSAHQPDVDDIHQNKDQIGVTEPLHRILVAEDNPINQHLMKMTLKRLGYGVDIVENGAQALAKLQEQTYSLILMDIHMPEMDGLEATQRIRMLGGLYATIPIIAVTASILPEEQHEFIKAGMNDIIEKPFSGKQLRLLITQWISGERS
ncbi:MAG: response regulator [Anaerolineae bacterium]|nr:response regulator [Anaerolineae bacterium]